MTPVGLLHSEICGSMPTYGSPQLIAVSRVLLRLPVPRHSPCALCSLTMCFSCSDIGNSLLSHRISFLALEIAVIYPRLSFFRPSLVNNSFSLLYLLRFIQFSRYRVRLCRTRKAQSSRFKEPRSCFARPLYFAPFPLKLSKSNFNLASQDQSRFPAFTGTRKVSSILLRKTGRAFLALMSPESPTSVALSRVPAEHLRMFPSS